MSATNEQIRANAIEIAPDTWWVGKRPPGAIFYANPYLRRFRHAGAPGTHAGEFTVVFDPGSSSDFSVVMAKTVSVLGSMENISAICINHQDPDVGSSTGVILGRYAPGAKVLCTEETWRLVQYYNIPRQRLVQLEKYTKSGLPIPTGHKLIPVPSPFCHFVGAMMMYDPDTRVLFSGDLFGALTDANATGLYADESDWVGMRTFHQLYMPTTKAIKNAFREIRNIDPPIELIAPQHGRLIRGDWIREFMTRLENLPVGLDILTDRQATPDVLRGWTTVLQRVIDTARGLLGDDAIEKMLRDSQIREAVKVSGGHIEILTLGKTTVEHAVRVLTEHAGAMGSAVKYEAIVAAEELGLPSPAIDIEEEGGSVTGLG